MLKNSRIRRKGKILLLSILFLLTAGLFAFTTINQNSKDDQILSYSVNIKTQDLKLYWKNDNGETLNSIRNLKNYVESKNLTLKFAMNGGMFTDQFGPVGLFIQDGKTIKKINNSNGKGNFNWKPNGVFYITEENVPVVCQTSEFVNKGNIKNATQSGPMLLINGKIHDGFEKSTSLNIRNGVGILPNNNVVFAMSKKEITFYDFAKYFQNLGCKNALYLDGAVSRMYLPEKKWEQTDGNFGVMIGVTNKKNK
jgi:uncharacterized protein YigE (DUF2233 family)